MPYTDLQKAVSLSKWLIEKKGKKPNVAYIIACNKYKLPMSDRSWVRKEYQKVKGIDPNQKTLF